MNHTTSLSTAAAEIGAPLESLAAWERHRPEAFRPGPLGYSIEAIRQAGDDYAAATSETVTALVKRLTDEMESYTATAQRIQARAAQVIDALAIFHVRSAELSRIFDEAWPAVQDLSRDESLPHSLPVLTAMVERTLDSVRAAGLADIESMLGRAPVVVVRQDKLQAADDDEL